MSAAPFAALADLAESLEALRSRIEMAERIAAFLRGLAPEEVGPAVRLLPGQIFGASDPRTLNVSWTSVSAVVDAVAAAAPEERQAISAEAVHSGQAVRLLFERARREPRRRPVPGLLEVYHTLEAIASVSGARSHERKAALLQRLLGRMGPVEAKLLAKDVFGEVRHGAGEGVVLDAISRAAGLEPALLRRARADTQTFNEIQASPRYRSRLALRFARVVRLRHKSAADADTLSTLQALYERQFESKGRPAA